METRTAIWTSLVALAFAVGVSSAALPPVVRGGPAWGAGGMSGPYANLGCVETSTGLALARGLKVSGGSQYLIPADQTEECDLYLWSQELEVDGTLDGDLIGWFQSGRIRGTVTQDVNIFAQELYIEGEVGDDVRALCQEIQIDGVVGDDVLVGAATVEVGRDAVIEGDFLVGAGVVTIDGTVKGDARIGTGMLTVNGTIEGDVQVTTDGGINLGPDARIGGDLSYECPSEIEFQKGVVVGNITFSPKEKDVEAKLDLLPKVKLAFHIFFYVAALIAGSVLFAFTKDHAKRTAGKLREKPLKSLGIGFIAFICIPIVILICMLLVVSIPLGLILMLGYITAAYIAKFYAATWLGNLVLRRHPDASPMPAMLLGITMLYAVTWIPILGGLVAFIAAFLGLGALLQGKGTRLNGAFEPAPAEAAGLPNAFPDSGTEG